MTQYKLLAGLSCRSRACFLEGDVTFVHYYVCLALPPAMVLSFFLLRVVLQAQHDVFDTISRVNPATVVIELDEVRASL